MQQSVQKFIHHCEEIVARLDEPIVGIELGWWDKIATETHRLVDVQNEIDWPPFSTHRPAVLVLVYRQGRSVCRHWNSNQKAVDRYRKEGVREAVQIRWHSPCGAFRSGLLHRVNADGSVLSLERAEPLYNVHTLAPSPVSSPLDEVKVVTQRWLRTAKRVLDTKIVAEPKKPVSGPPDADRSSAEEHPSPDLNQWTVRLQRIRDRWDQFSLQAGESSGVLLQSISMPHNGTAAEWLMRTSDQKTSRFGSGLSLAPTDQRPGMSRITRFTPWGAALERLIRESSELICELPASRARTYWSSWPVVPHVGINNEVWIDFLFEQGWKSGRVRRHVQVRCNGVICHHRILTNDLVPKTSDIEVLQFQGQQTVDPEEIESYGGYIAEFVSEIEDIISASQSLLSELAKDIALPVSLPEVATAESWSQHGCDLGDEGTTAGGKPDHDAERKRRGIGAGKEMDGDEDVVLAARWIKDPLAAVETLLDFERDYQAALKTEVVGRPPKTVILSPAGNEHRLRCLTLASAYRLSAAERPEVFAAASAEVEAYFDAVRCGDFEKGGEIAGPFIDALVTIKKSLQLKNALASDNSSEQGTAAQQVQTSVSKPCETGKDGGNNRDPTRKKLNKYAFWTAVKAIHFEQGEHKVVLKEGDPVPNKKFKEMGVQGNVSDIMRKNLLLLYKDEEAKPRELYGEFCRWARQDPKSVLEYVDRKISECEKDRPWREKSASVVALNGRDPNWKEREEDIDRRLDSELG